MSDPVTTRQPFQPVGEASHDGILHAISTNHSEAALTVRSDGTIGSRHK
jgi:hypothetical protein